MHSGPPRAALALFVLAAIGCGDKPAPTPRAGTTTPPIAAGQHHITDNAIDDRPPEAVLDDEALLAVVYATAARDLPFPEAIKKLPPRISRARVAVRALHDHLLGVVEAPEDRAKLLAALEKVAAECSGGADEKVLPGLLAKWKTWTKEQADAEREIAVRLTRGLDLVRAPKDDQIAAIPAAFGNLPAAPPGSPGAAGMAALRAIHLALVQKTDEWPKPLDDAVTQASMAFDNLGWPGGLGVYLEIGAARLERDGKPSLRSLTFGDRARDAFLASGDGVRAAMITQDRAESARRNGLTAAPDKQRGELDRSVKLYAQTIDQLDKAGCRGAEIMDACYARAETLQMLERHDEALVSLERCAKEIAFTKSDPAQLAPVEERRATSLFRLGRFADAHAAATEGAKSYDANVTGIDPQREKLRASLDELAGESLVEMGKGADGAPRYVAAAERHAKLPGGDPDASRDRLLAARALALGGKRDEARAMAKAELARSEVTPGMRVAAAAVFREAGFPGDARREYDAVATRIPPDVRDTLAAEEARLCAAEGKLDDARRFFAAAENRLTGGDRQRPGGPEAWQVTLDWARMEEKAGDFEEASRLADRAIGHLGSAKFPVELDRAQAVYVRALRRRFQFAAAEPIAAERVKNGAPGGGLEDAALDLALLRMETQGAAPPASTGKRSREALIQRVVAERSKPVADPAPDRNDLAASIPPDEPELRHWVLREAGTEDDVRWLDLWCGGDGVTGSQVADANGAARVFFGVAAAGKEVVYAWSGGHASGTNVRDGDGGLRKLYDAVRVDPSGGRLEAALREFAAPLEVPPQPAVTWCVPAPHGPIPADLLPRDGGNIAIDEWNASFVMSPSELVAAAKRPKPALLTVVRSPEQPLTTRYALCPVAPVDPKWGARLLVLAGEQMNKGLDAGAAVRAAKLALRAEWKPGPKDVGVPPWAAYELRGVP